MTHSEALLRLQQVDLELLRRDRALEALPQTQKIKQIKAAAKKLVSELNKVIGARKDAETDLADNRVEYGHMVEVLDRVQAEAAQGSNDYRIVKDFEEQLSHLAKRMEKLDFDKAEIERRLAKLRDSEDKARGVGARLQQEGKAQAEAYERDSASIKAEKDELTRERRSLLADLPTDLVDRYEVARKRFGGIAVESLHGNNPSVCRVALQPSDFSDLRASGADICECPYCHRILITSEVFE
ncbi:zinc ribbon domain-containing protein [Atopobiaceae bacterium LCP21S3_F11]